MWVNVSQLRFSTCSNERVKKLKRRNEWAKLFVLLLFSMFLLSNVVFFIYCLCLTIKSYELWPSNNAARTFRTPDRYSSYSCQLEREAAACPVSFHSVIRFHNVFHMEPRFMCVQKHTHNVHMDWALWLCVTRRWYTLIIVYSFILLFYISAINIITYI